MRQPSNDISIPFQRPASAFTFPAHMQCFTLHISWPDASFVRISACSEPSVGHTYLSEDCIVKSNGFFFWQMALDKVHIAIEECQ